MTPGVHRRCRRSRDPARLEPLVQVATDDAQLAVGQLAALGSPALGAPVIERGALDPQLLAHLSERELLVRIPPRGRNRYLWFPSHSRTPRSDEVLAIDIIAV